MLPYEAGELRCVMYEGLQRSGVESIGDVRVEDAVDKGEES